MAPEPLATPPAAVSGGRPRPGHIRIKTMAPRTPIQHSASIQIAVRAPKVDRSISSGAAIPMPPNRVTVQDFYARGIESGRPRSGSTLGMALGTPGMILRHARRCGHIESNAVEDWKHDRPRRRRSSVRHVRPDDGAYGRRAGFLARVSQGHLSALLPARVVPGGHGSPAR